MDGEIIYTNGRTAALEITSVEASEVWHLRNRLDRMKPTPAPGYLLWTIRPRNVAELDRLVSIHERVIAICEAHGVTDPEQLPYDVIAHGADLTWLAWEEFHGRMSGHEVTCSPRVFWEQPIEFAVFSSEADEIAAGVTSALQVEPSLKHVAKLLRDQHDERHLFLVVGSTGLSNAAAFALIEAEEVPAMDPDLPDGIDHLWLGPGHGGTVTVWSRERGWRNDRIAEPPANPRLRRTTR